MCTSIFRFFFAFLLWVLPLLINFIALEARAETCAQLPEIVEKTLASAAAKDAASEPCEVRETTRGDLDGDGNEDIVVIFSLEGACFDKKEKPGTCGNNFGQFLQVFFAEGKDFKVGPRSIIGGKFTQIGKDPRIKPHHIILTTTSWATNDPGCCPSVAGSLELVLENGALVEKK